MSKDGNCTAKIPTPDGWGTYRCSRKAVRDGFCTQHHPDEVKARNAVQAARWKLENDIANARAAVRTCGDKVRDAAVAYYTGVTTVDSVIENAVRDYTAVVNRLKALEENENV